MKAIINLTAEQMLKVRLNQPRVSVEELIRQENRLKRMSEEFCKEVRDENPKSKQG